MKRVLHLEAKMAHYLSDYLPNIETICLNCKENVWRPETLNAWDGYLKTCTCADPDHCSITDVEISWETGVIEMKRKQ